MDTVNFRDRYEFDPETYASGGLVGLLSRAMRESNLQKQEADFGSTPDE